MGLLNFVLQTSFQTNLSVFSGNDKPSVSWSEKRSFFGLYFDEMFTIFVIVFLSDTYQ